MPPAAKPDAHRGDLICYRLPEYQDAIEQLSKATGRAPYDLSRQAMTEFLIRHKGDLPQPIETSGESRYRLLDRIAKAVGWGRHTPAEIRREIAVILQEEGYSLQEIGKIFRVSKQTIHQDISTQKTS